MSREKEEEEGGRRIRGRRIRRRRRRSRRREMNLEKMGYWGGKDRITR